jgi:hypothetical protein
MPSIDDWPVPNTLSKSHFVLGVIDGDDRVAQGAVGGHGAQAMHAGGRLLGAADDAICELGVLFVHREDEIGAVVERQRRLELQRLADAPVEFVDVHSVPGVDRDAVGGQRRGDVVLGRERVAARPGNLGTGGMQSAHQHGGFLGDVQAAGDPHAGERLRFREALLECHHHRHARLGPLDAHASGVGELRIGDLGVHDLHVFSRFQLELRTGPHRCGSAR